MVKISLVLPRKVYQFHTRLGPYVFLYKSDDNFLLVICRSNTDDFLIVNSDGLK